MFLLLCKGLYLGFCVAVPVGPIGLICIRSGLVHGFRHCLSAGMGAACADAIYGIAATAGLGAAIMAYPQAAMAIKYIGALFLIYLGIGIIRGGTEKTEGATSSPTSDTVEPPPASARQPSLPGLFRSTMLLTLANPMTITSFVGMFAACGLGDNIDAGKSSIVVAGVFLGSAAWWLILALLMVWIRARLKEQCNLGELVAVSRLSGVLITIFGAWSIVEGLSR
jgi:threonine/homoserine/homoserine lactone efflux protein